MHPVPPFLPLRSATSPSPATPMIQVPEGLWHSSLSLVSANAPNRGPYPGEPLSGRATRTASAWVKKMGPGGSRSRRNLEPETWLCLGCPVLSISHLGPSEAPFLAWSAVSSALQLTESPLPSPCLCIPTCNPSHPRERSKASCSSPAVASLLASAALSTSLIHSLLQGKGKKGAQTPKLPRATGPHYHPGHTQITLSGVRLFGRFGGGSEVSPHWCCRQRTTVPGGVVFLPVPHGQD